MSIHRFGLNNPRRKILLPQRPKDGDKRYRHQNVEDNFAGFLVENFAPIRPQADRRDMDEFLSAQPKNNGGEGHEDAGEPESDVGTMQAGTFEKTDHRWRQLSDEAIWIGFVGFEQPRNQKC